MNYYVLPGTGLYGGIKEGYRFADLLNELGAPCAVVTPDGQAPGWFRSSAPTLPEAGALARLGARDNLIFSLPHDHPRLAALPGRKVFHCQGTDPLIDPVLRDPHLTLLSCWPQAAAYLRERAGREPIDVGLSIPDTFYHRGLPKDPATVAYMPRRGAALASACAAALPHLRFAPIDGMAEPHVANLLQRCECYLATARGEWFGLPALEAMAAGCVVFSVPTIGGVDYLRDGINSVVADGDELVARLREWTAPAAAGRRAALRDHARVTAAAYRPARQRANVAGLLAGPLSFLRP